MEVIVDQWNDAENEIEEVLLQPKKGLQLSIDTIETHVEGGGLKQEKNENDIVITEIGRIEITPTHGFYCPNCYSCIRKVHIEGGERERAIPQKIKCSSCLSFITPYLAPISGVPEEVESNKALEIVKSMVYGGYTEIFASLTVVISAASAKATISNIVTLALANLVGGLFIFVHNLQVLKAEEPKKAENETKAPVDRYKELLGERKNFYVHAFIAILSFVVFGLVPPLVYGFSFRENGDKDFMKLGAVVVTSLLCVALLSIAKAYTKKSKTLAEYFKTMFDDVSNGAMSLFFTYFQLTGMLSEQKMESSTTHEAEAAKSVRVSQNTTTMVVDNGDYSETNKVEIKTNDNGVGSIDWNNATSQDSKGPVAPMKKHFLSNWEIRDEALEVSMPKHPKTDSSSKNSDWRVIMPPNDEHSEITLEVNVDGDYTGQHLPYAEDAIQYSTPTIQDTNRDRRSLFYKMGNYFLLSSMDHVEIVKSIVYGGLTESLASLTVVTSAASADASTWSIVALVLANLISGLFIFLHDLQELKGEEAKLQTEACAERYYEVLGKRKKLYLEAFITIISFIVFGLVPPLVYGFTFHDNNDQGFKKLIAVVGVSLLCIALLSIAKAYTQKPDTFVAYFKTVIYYVTSAVVCLVLSYLAGDLVKKLLEKVSRLEPSSNFGMSVQKNEWSSY